MTTKEFATLSGVTESQVSRWLSRKTYPSRASMKKLSDYLMVDPRIFDCAGDNLNYLSLDYLHTQYLCETTDPVLQAHLFTTATGVAFNRTAELVTDLRLSLGGEVPTWAVTSMELLSPQGWAVMSDPHRTYAIFYHDGVSMDFITQVGHLELSGPFGLADRYFKSNLLNTLTPHRLRTGVGGCPLIQEKDRLML